MDINIFSDIPKRWLCPYCGHWHKWEGGSLESGRVTQKCPDKGWNRDKVTFFKSIMPSKIIAHIEPLCKEEADTITVKCSREEIENRMEMRDFESGVGAFHKYFQLKPAYPDEEYLCSHRDTCKICGNAAGTDSLISAIGISWMDDPMLTHSMFEKLTDASENEDEYEYEYEDEDEDMEAEYSSDDGEEAENQGEIIPKMWLCPYCCQWHKWEGHGIDNSLSIQTCPNMNDIITFSLKKSGDVTVRLSHSCECGSLDTEAVICSNAELQNRLSTYKDEETDGAGTYVVKGTVEFPVCCGECNVCDYSADCMLRKGNIKADGFKNAVMLSVGLSAKSEEPYFIPVKTVFSAHSGQDGRNENIDICSNGLDEDCDSECSKMHTAVDKASNNAQMEMLIPLLLIKKGMTAKAKKLLMLRAAMNAGCNRNTANDILLPMLIMKRNQEDGA